MKHLCITLLILATAAPASARELIGKTQVAEKPVLLFDDGFWRFDDSVGEICTKSGSHGEVCALPSKWSRIPEMDKSRRGLPTFVQDELQAEFRVLQHWDNEDLTMSDVSAYFRNETSYSGLNGTLLSQSNARIGNLEGGHVVIQAGTRGVYAFTFVFQNGRFLIARTLEQDTTLYHTSHKRAHQEFIESLRIAPFERP